MTTKVFLYGCRSPRDAANESLAIQLLGQASNHADELRAIYNRFRRKLSNRSEDAHVIAWSRQPERREERNAEIRAARAARGHLVDMGTYWLTEKAAAQANSRTKVGAVIGRKRWDGTGRIGAAIPSRDKPRVAEDGSVSHSRISLSAVDDRRYAILRITVGPMKKPTTLAWPIKLHRPLPVGAVVDLVHVQRVRNGWRYRWEAAFTCTFDDVAKDRPRGVAVLKVRPGDDRVAEVSLPDGRTWTIDVPVRRSLEYADSVQSIRDQHFDVAKALAGERHGTDQIHPAMWRDKSRLSRLALRTGDEDLTRWRYRDRHLEDIAAGVRRRAERRRLDAYRVAASRLAREASVVAVDDVAPETDRVLAIGELLEAIGHRVPLCFVAASDVETMRASCERWIAEHGTVRARTAKQPERKGDIYEAPNAGAEHEYEVDTARKPTSEAAE